MAALRCAKHPGANAGAIALYSDRLHLDPVILGGDIVPEKGGRLVHIDDQNIHVAIVIEVPECAAAAGVWRGNTGTRLVNQLLELAVPQIAKNDPRRFCGITGQLLLNFRIHIAGNQEQIRTAVIVEIHDTRAPSDESGLHAQSRAVCDVFKGSFAVVVIEDVSIVGEMRLEDVEIPVEIEIADAHAHACLLRSVLVNCDSA